MKNVTLERMLDSTSLMLTIEHPHIKPSVENSTATLSIARQMRVERYKQLVEKIDFDAAISYYGMQHKQYYAVFGDVVRVNNAMNHKPLDGPPATLLTLNNAYVVYCTLVSNEINRRLRAMFNNDPC